MYENYIGKPNFKNVKRINSKLVGVEMKYSSIKINKPFYISMSILDLSKWHMYNFHYIVMKPIFGDRVHLLYCYIVGLGLTCKFIDLLFKHSFIKFIEISLYLDFIVLEIICKQTDTFNQELIHQRQF